MVSTLARGMRLPVFVKIRLQARWPLAHVHVHVRVMYGTCTSCMAVDMHMHIAWHMTCVMYGTLHVHVHVPCMRHACAMPRLCVLRHTLEQTLVFRKP